MTGPTIRFTFDYESPNAYLAWNQLPALAARHGASIEPAPVLYAALLAAHGQLGPGEIPAKMFWMHKNLARKAALLGVELNRPAFVPFNPLLALRVTLLASGADARAALIDALFRAVWVRGLHVAEPSVVADLVREVGLDGPALVARAQEPEVKDRLRRATDEAVARGVFGVPALEVGDELFWGYDDFPFLDRFLAGEDPLDPAQWGRGAYRPPPVGSERRGLRPR